MKKKEQQPFFFPAGKRAVLLLHGFTGSSADVRMLGRFLEKKAIQVMRPITEAMVYRRKNSSKQGRKNGGKMS